MFKKKNQIIADQVKKFWWRNPCLSPVQNRVAYPYEANHWVLAQVGADVRWDLAPEVRHQKWDLDR